MKVLVTGGRDYDDYETVACALAKYDFRDDGYVINGGATGADQLARRWCDRNDVACLTVPARWEHYGLSAGIRRNNRMVEMSPDVVVAFPGGKGTAHTKQYARDVGIPVEEYR